MCWTKMSEKSLSYVKVHFGLITTHFNISWTLIMPEFFYFSFCRPSGSNFFKIETKIKRDFFSILFLYFPLTHASTVLEFNYVFSFRLSYCSQVD